MNFDIATSSAEGVLTLLGLRGIGPQAVEKLLRKFSNLGAIRDSTESELDGVTAAARASLREPAAWEAAHGRALTILAEAERRAVRVLTVGDADYPAMLREVHDRPPVLYAKGCLRRDRRAVACIGTREPSRFGEEVTRRITATLAERGWSIVSGLAIGVDALAHRAALGVKAHTVAVLANGLDTIYPKKNQALAEEILASGGAWVSEQPFGTAAIPRNLVQRDRLQSGMSVATIVMQTDIVGGSMHTVKFTLLQGRLVVAPVPQGHHAEDQKSRGILALTQKTGSELARALDATGEYAALLRGSFADRPVAMPLVTRDDYEPLIARLDEISRTVGATSKTSRRTVSQGEQSLAASPVASTQQTLRLVSARSSVVTIGEEIRAYRTRQSLTPDAFARRFEIDVAAVAQLEALTTPLNLGDMTATRRAVNAALPRLCMAAVKLILDEVTAAAVPPATDGAEIMLQAARKSR